jgi:hypothetical protein
MYHTQFQQAISARAPQVEADGEAQDDHVGFSVPLRPKQVAMPVHKRRPALGSGQAFVRADCVSEQHHCAGAVGDGLSCCQNRGHDLRFAVLWPKTRRGEPTTRQRHDAPMGLGEVPAALPELVLQGREAGRWTSPRRVAHPRKEGGGFRPDNILVLADDHGVRVLDNVHVAVHRGCRAAVLGSISLDRPVSRPPALEVLYEVKADDLHHEPAKWIFIMNR